MTWVVTRTSQMSSKQRSSRYAGRAAQGNASPVPQSNFFALDTTQIINPAHTRDSRFFKE